jgi:hypothetical protein
MASHPLNLALRFVLELAALGAMGHWAYRSVEGWARFALALGVPLLAATLWGVFAVPADPSRSGGAPVPVPGAVRLGLELTFFGFASWALRSTGQPRAALCFGAITLAHYLVSYDRLRWLLRA